MKRFDKFNLILKDKVIQNNKISLLCIDILSLYSYIIQNLLCNNNVLYTRYEHSYPQF